MNVKNQIRNFIIDNYLSDENQNFDYRFGESANLKDDTSFINEGIIDSVSVYELVGFIESQYAISVNNDEFLPENLDCINNLASYLDMKMRNRING